MNIPPDDLLPPMRLALAYAPKQVRAAWALVLRLDARMANIVCATSEPLIGQMKLAWWRDAINAAPSARPRGEPLLSALSNIDNRVADIASAKLVDAWETLIVAEDWTMIDIERFASERGLAIFDGYTKLCNLTDFSLAIAQHWAVDDLRTNFGSRVPEHVVVTGRLPKNRAFRPLTILAMSARPVSGPRLIWHALTGH